VLIRGHVFWPELSFLDVVCRELPPLCRLIDSIEKTLSLFFLRKVEEKLEDWRAAAGKLPFERADVFEALLPRILAHQLFRNALLLEHLGMHPHHQDFLIVGTVENADTAACRQPHVGAPEKIVRE